MPLFKTKPVIKEAWKSTDILAGKSPGEFSNAIRVSELVPDCFDYYIETMEGTMTADINDWIIKGIRGEFYPCKPDVFEKTYEVTIPWQ